MKKILSLFALLMTIVIGAKAADESAILYWESSQTSANSIQIGDFTIAITGNTGKNWSNGNGDITIGSTSYKTLKNSNGAQNTITCPDGYVATGITFYAVTNDGSTKGKLSELDGTPCTDEVSSLKDYSNPTVISKNIEEKESFTFTFSTKQVCFIAVVTYKAKEAHTTPFITKEPEDVVYEAGSTVYPEMSVTAQASDAGGALSYEWYANLGAPVDVKLSTLVGELAQNATIKYADLKDLVAPYVKPGFSLTMRCEVTEEGITDPVSSQSASVDVVVAKPVVSPASGTAFGESITMTATCVTEGAVVQYLDGNEWKPVGEGVEFTETVDDLRVKAVYEPEPGTSQTSEEVYVTYIKFTPEALSSISDATTWTLTNNLDEVKLSDATTPKKYDDFYTYNDVATLTDRVLPADFSGSTLAFSGEYPFRGSNGAQNCNLQFITTVPGTVSIEFSNTGGSNDKRWVKVNETVGTVEAKGTTHRTEDFTVGAGLVTISHVKEDGSPSGGLRFYTVTFTPGAEDVPVALINGDGYATYSYTKSVQLKEEYADDVKIYYGSSLTADALTLTEIEQKIIPAETGVIIAVNPDAGIDEVQFDLFDSADVPYIEINFLRPTTTANGKADPKKPTDGSPAALTLDGNVFKTFVGDEFNDYKAYISIDDLPSESNSLNIVFQDSETAVKAITEVNEAVEAPVKVVKNGQLYIGNYNVAGQQVK